MAKDTASAAQADMHSGTEAPTRKRRAPEGPRKRKPLHLAVTVHDADGNPISGAKVEVHKVDTDFENIYGHIEQHPHMTRVRVPLGSTAE